MAGHTGNTYRKGHKYADKTAAVLILDLQDCGQLFHEQGTSRKTFP